MQLPELPRQLNKREAKIDSKVLEWFANNYPYTVAVEVKIKGNKVLPHQELALKEVQNGSFKYKIADSGIRLPFDGFVLKGAEAYVVTCDQNTCHAIRIDKNREFTFKIK